MTKSDFPYIYAWGPSFMRPTNRKGMRCRVLVRGKMNSCLLEFEDGFQTITSRNAIRKPSNSLTEILQNAPLLGLIPPGRL